MQLNQVIKYMFIQFFLHLYPVVHSNKYDQLSKSCSSFNVWFEGAQLNYTCMEKQSSICINKSEIFLQVGGYPRDRRVCLNAQDTP